MRLPLAFALGFAFVASAAAQGMAPAAGTFFVKDKGWTIWSGPRGCDAVNRDLTEFNVAPVNALWLTHYAGQARRRFCASFIGRALSNRSRPSR